MRRTVLLILAFALPGFSQVKQPQPRSTAEYNGYMAVYDEKDAPKQAAPEPGSLKG